MQLNLTFILQLIHFLITYRILERLLFAPAIAMVQEREATECRLVEDCSAEEEKLKELSTQKKIFLRQFQQRIQGEHDQVLERCRSKLQFVEPPQQPLTILTGDQKVKIKELFIKKVLHE